jgi:hypothetical protein
VRLRALRRRWQQQLRRDVLYPSTRGCNSARRGARRGRSLQCELHGLLPPSPLDRRAPTAHADGTSSAGRDGARGRGGGGAVRRRAGVHLPLSRLVCRELSTQFRPLLRRAPARAAAAAVFGFGCAARRYPKLSWTAPSAPRSSSSATDAEWPSIAAECSGVHLHGRRRRRLGAAHSTADSPRAQTAHPKSFLAFTSASASTSDRTIRRLP